MDEAVAPSEKTSVGTKVEHTIESDDEAMLTACLAAEMKVTDMVMEPGHSSHADSSGAGPEVPLPGCSVNRGPVPICPPATFRVGGKMDEDPWVGCPGCGVLGPMPSKGVMTAEGPFECLWGRHECGASWTISSIPRGMARGALLHIWMPDQLSDIARGRTRWGRFPRCTGCLQPWTCEMIQCLGDPNKAMGHFSCSSCKTTMFGILTLEYGGFVHYSMAAFKREPVEMTPRPLSEKERVKTKAGQDLMFL